MYRLNTFTGQNVVLLYLYIISICVYILRVRNCNTSSYRISPVKKTQQQQQKKAKKKKKKTLGLHLPHNKFDFAFAQSDQNRPCAQFGLQSFLVRNQTPSTVFKFIVLELTYFLRGIDTFYGGGNSVESGERCRQQTPFSEGG